MSVQVRNAMAADAEALVRLSKQLGYDADIPSMKQRIQTISESGNDIVLVATENERVLGWLHAFVTMRIESGAFAEIGGLVVDETQRSKGIGKILVEQAKSWSREKHIEKLRVRSNVIRNNAHAFYKREGFLEMKEQKVLEWIVPAE